MSPRAVLSALRAGWWMPALAMLVGAAAALGVSLLITPVYTAETQLFVSTTDSASASDVFQGGQFSQQRVASYAELLEGEELARRVVEALDLPLEPDELAEDVSATAVTNTVLLEVSVTHPSPETARDIAEAIGREFSGLVAELETPVGSSTPPVEVNVVQRPVAPDEPSEPQVPRNIALGLLTGLLAGGVLAVARARLDRSLRDPDEVAELAGAPVIGTILRDDTLRERPVLDRTSSSRTAEGYRQLRTNLQFLNVDEPPRTIMVSSALEGEGKTTLAINLAIALAEVGRRVVVVEADLRRPRVGRYLGLVDGVGLTNVLAGSAELGDVLQTYGEDAVAVLASGPIPPNPGELLASDQMASLLAELRAGHDYVVVDAPPVLPVADATGLAVLVDGVLLSVRYGATRKDHLHQVGTMLDRVRARTLGVILNLVPPSAEIAAAHGYDSVYGAAEKEPGRRRGR